MNNTLDIVKLIEKNPITRLDQEYQNKFIDKIKINFTESQQQLFLGSFYCYLNFNAKTDFVIDLNDIWKWLGFTRKDNCKRVLEKQFIKEIDYKLISLQVEENKVETRGRKEEQLLINIITFKKFYVYYLKVK